MPVPARPGGGSLRAMKRSLVPCLVALAACGGSEVAEPEPVQTETGGEDTAPVEVEPPPPPMRTTVPVPVPQPAVAREQLSMELQAVWDAVERVVHVRAPEPPEEASEEAINAWADGPFAEWFTRRRTEMERLGTEVATLAQRSPPPHEVIIAAALLGYAYEDMAAGVRGAPIPEALAADQELLAIYVNALTEATRPIAQEATRGYAHCVRVFSENDDGAWAEWGQYCDDRGAEVVEVFGLQ